jgi:addiction module HigA family antidote
MDTGASFMTIRTEELESMDFSDVAEGGKLPPIHPGEILREEFLVPLKIAPHARSLALQIPATRINDIVRERRAITIDTALRLARYFGNTAEFWMGLQTDYDMAIARDSLRDALNRIHRFDPAHA